MQLNFWETHDRYKAFTKKQFDIDECCQDLIDKRPFGNYPFYIFAHARTEDDGVKKRLIWQPRLTKPKPQTNSMLFKAYPGTDQVKIFWMLPARELWPSFQLGKMAHNKTILDSIYDFQHNREKMAAKEDDDLSDEVINRIYEELAKEAKIKNSKSQYIKI